MPRARKRASRSHAAKAKSHRTASSTLARAYDVAREAVKNHRTRPFKGLNDSYGLKPDRTDRSGVH